MSIAVIIPSKTISNLEPCVQAVRANEPDVEIVVIDDGVGLTHRDAFEAFNQRHSRVSVIGGVRPFVFSRNVNLGLRFALTSFSGTNARGEFVVDPPRHDGAVVLNDDAILQTPGGFSLLAQSAAEHPEYGIIAATCNNVGNVNQWPQGIGLREDPRMVCFVAVYIPRTTIETVGLLDERFGSGGFEDDDYCVRVRRAGLRIGIHDGCYVDHGSLVSTFRGPAGPGYNPRAADIFREKWGAGNHEI